MGSGGLRGLQNRCFGAEASKGWFDSDTPPPRKAEGRRQKAEGRRQKAEGRRQKAEGRSAGATRRSGQSGALLPSALCLLPYCLGASVKNPIFIAPPSWAASIASTARSN